MPDGDLLPFDPLEHVRYDGTQLIEIVIDHGFATPVPTCPEWDLGDLVWHVGSVWNHFATVVSQGCTTIEEYRAVPRPSRPADDQLVDWVTAAHTALVAVLAETPDDQPVFTWAGLQDTVWVQRRMVHETTVHRWDAASAVGIPYEVPAAVAADGIDEFLRWHAGEPLDGAEPVGGTVHLHCTDLDDHVAEGTDDRSAAVGEWLVTSLQDGWATFTREHAKGDAAVRGRSHDLFMWCWRRAAGPVEVIGDADVAARFQAYSDL